jgi:hypothetical protein
LTVSEFAKIQNTKSEFLQIRLRVTNR